MKIVIAYPPNYERIAQTFNIRGRSNIIFAYGDKLYNPSGGRIDDALMKHEETHERQQSLIGVDVWWNQYLNDRQFRLSQEVEAYQNQYRHAKLTYNTKGLETLLKQIATDLSSEIYGKIISFDEAINLITYGSNDKSTTETNGSVGSV